jgi:putative DNA primase/helicase
VVASHAIVTASVLWTVFTYLVEIAVYAPKLLFTFPERDAGKSAALDVLRWMVQRGYPAVEVTGAVLFRIIDRLRPTPVLQKNMKSHDQADIVPTTVRKIMSR